MMQRNPLAGSLVVLFSVLLTGALLAESCPGADPSAGFTIAQLKYRGGGDWYANPTALPNLLAAVSTRTDLDVAEEVAALRKYFERGGFLWADDNYGMDRHFRAQMDRLLPGSPLVELPFDHEIYHSFYEFHEGLPKIHEHDGGPPHGYGAFLDGRLVVFYSFNTDVGDGLEDTEVHNDPPEKHEAALRMGINIVVYALSH
jgi:hypothetical protein